MNRLQWALARWRFGIQMHVSELRTVARALRPPRRFLVFGLGNDSVLWHRLNAGGRTCFIESDVDWYRRVTGRHPQIEAHLVRYATRRPAWRELLEQPERLAMELPGAVADTGWDVVLVDGPPGWHDGAEGRMQSIYMAARLVRGGGDVFVHDAEREVERAYCARYLGRANLVGRVRGSAVLEHYRTPSPG